MRAQGELPEGQEGGLGHRALFMEKAESATRGPHPSASQTPSPCAGKAKGGRAMLVPRDREGERRLPLRGKSAREYRISDRRRYDDQ